MAEFFDVDDKESHAGFETATYHFGCGRFAKSKSHIAQHILETLIEIEDLTDIYIETHIRHEKELTNLINSGNLSIQFDFDCNMVLENSEGAVVTGDLKSLELSEDRKSICAKTADSLFCFELN